jgi:hypothetical protein
MQENAITNGNAGKVSSKSHAFFGIPNKERRIAMRNIAQMLMSQHNTMNNQTFCIVVFMGPVLKPWRAFISAQLP